ncbi:CBS domain-containing protein [Streptomyces sp. NPDC005805]|uniref:CBS domain-containing protein n=1 Tax=Streptomyces sp. NPDC005805 TaxID=3157068 RepID=UPI0033F0F887
MSRTPRTPRTVDDVMTHAPVAVGRDASYREIAALLADRRISAVPVLEGDGRVIGVVSEADLLPAAEYAAAGGAGPDPAGTGEALTADRLMSSPAVTVHAGAGIAEAARIMARRRVKRLPVVGSGGLLEGVVSRGDLLKVFLRPDAEIAAEIREDVLPGLPGPADVSVSVAEGAVTVTGALRDRELVPLLARAVRAVEGVVDVRMDLSAPVPAGATAGPPARTAHGED